VLLVRIKSFWKHDGLPCEAEIFGTLEVSLNTLVARPDTVAGAVNGVGKVD
jgi:hypothetical protein